MKLHRPFAFAIVVAAAACGGHSLSGKYADNNGMMAVEFKSDKAYVTTMGGTAEVKYEVDGDKVVLSNPEGNMVLTRASDGSLDGGPTGKLVKQ